MKKLLFSPFDIGKWFLLGFSAWLAYLGESGGSFNLKDDLNWAKGEGGGVTDWSALLDRGREFFQEHTALVLGVGASVLLIGLAIGLALLWVRCRGKFMFLDNVVNNRCLISEPWSEYAVEGNSLFMWNVVFSLISLLLMLPFLALLIMGVAIPCMKAGGFDATALPALIGGSTLILLLALVLVYVARFLEDFIVPIMYKRRIATTSAWGVFLPVLKQNMGRFVLYGIFYFLLYLCWGAGILLLVLVTCCIALCPLILPYLWAVVLLPMLVFFRAYSLDYLSRYGEEFTVEMK